MHPRGGFWFVHGSPRKSVGMSRSPSLPLSPSDSRMYPVQKHSGPRYASGGFKRT